jgi:magnesium chelatase family protein
LIRSLWTVPQVAACIDLPYKLGFSARAHDKVLRVARTIADLDQNEMIWPIHCNETINDRMLDRQL